MRLIKSGPVSTDFLEESTKIFDMVNIIYETGNADFAVCKSPEDVYKVLANAFNHSDPSELDPHPSEKIGKVAPFAVVNFYDSEESYYFYNSEECYYFIYTCQDIAGNRRIRDEVLGNLDRYFWTMRKKPPIPMVV